MVTKNDIISIAKTIKTNVQKNGNIGTGVNIKGTGYGLGDISYLLNTFIKENGKDVDKVRVSNPNNAYGDGINRIIKKDEYIDMCNRVSTYIKTNHKLPAYVTTKKNEKVHLHLWIYQCAKIISFYAEKNRWGSEVLCNSADLKNPVFTYFEKTFGKVNSIDEALTKIKGKVYGYYYDDRYTNHESIDRIKKGQGVNCTDSCHVFWHIAKALGYEVKGIHVKCRGGDGHIRLDLKHPTNTGGEWIHRDPAAVLNGSGVNSIWCGNGTILAVNPAWFLENIDR